MPHPTVLSLSEVGFVKRKRQSQRVTMYCQSLHGVGHYVRAMILADALASIADVTLINAGRCCRKVGKPSAARLLALPGIYRDPQTKMLRLEDPESSWDETYRLRRELLEKHVLENPPQALVVDYFPFQRWESAEEILAFIRFTKGANPDAKIICSIRDFPRPASSASDRKRVLETLNCLFDYLLIHGEKDASEKSLTLECLAEVRIPMLTTGYVARVPIRKRFLNHADFRHDVFVSSGGGADSCKMILLCIEAWSRIVADGRDGSRRMSIFLGAYLAASDLHLIEAAARQTPSVRLLTFSNIFSEILHQADLSISCSGTNTCADVMAAGVRAIFIPSEAVADQCARAQRMETLGVGTAIFPGDLRVEFLQRAIERTLHSPRPSAAVSLDGAEFTKRFMERILKESRP